MHSLKGVLGSSHQPFRFEQNRYGQKLGLMQLRSQAVLWKSDVRLQVGNITGATEDNAAACSGRWSVFSAPM